MAYCIFRFQKLKLKDLAKSERHHNNRQHLKNREHPERENQNKSFRRDNTTLLKNAKKIIAEQEKRTGRKVRKDANVVIEALFTYSPERKLEEDKKAFEEWQKESIGFIKKAFGKNARILSAYLDMDETTPHIHVFFCPIDDKERINFKASVDKKTDIEKIQDLYAENMKRFGLQRGKKKELSKAFHEPLSKYYKKEKMNAEKQANEIIKNAEKQAAAILESAKKKAEEKILRDAEITRNEIFGFDDFER